MNRSHIHVKTIPPLLAKTLAALKPLWKLTRTAVFELQETHGQTSICNQHGCDCSQVASSEGRRERLLLYRKPASILKLEILPLKYTGGLKGTLTKIYIGFEGGEPQCYICLSRLPARMKGLSEVGRLKSWSLNLKLNFRAWPKRASSSGVRGRQKSIECAAIPMSRTFCG